MAKKLYVGNLSFDTSEQELHDLFAAAGTVESVNVVTDRVTGRPRGFGFVEMATDEDAQNAIAAVNNRELGGRLLTVNEARPKVSAGGYGGGGGGFGGGGYGGGGGNRRRSEPRW